MKHPTQEQLLNAAAKLDDAYAMLVSMARQQAAEPVAWTLTETLAKRKTTTRGFLWFSDPQNCLWTALYTRAAHQQQLTAADVRRAGGIVHSDGNVFFTNLDMLNKTITGSKEGGAA